MKFLIVVLFATQLANADDLREMDFIHEVSDEHYKQLSPRLYRAEGEHQCQSTESIGHTCKNLGVNFMDCNHAFFSLQREDCCISSDYGGRSIGFKITKCTNFN